MPAFQVYRNVSHDREVKHLYYRKRPSDPDGDCRSFWSWSYFRLYLYSMIHRLTQERRPEQCDLFNPQIIVNTQLVCDSILVYSHYGQKTCFNAYL